MTTVAYRDGILAADSLSTWGNARDGMVTKIAKRGPVLAATAGAIAGCQSFLDWFSAGMNGEPPQRPEDGDGCWFGYLFTPDNWTVMWGPRGWERARSDMMTLGTGGEYARGAMSAGATPEEAVAIAIKHDVKSGGPIHVLRR